jgi:hypothetical protein
MRKDDIVVPFDFTYWADRKVLEAASALPSDAFVRPAAIAHRDLRHLGHEPPDLEFLYDADTLAAGTGRAG